MASEFQVEGGVGPFSRSPKSGSKSRVDEETRLVEILDVLLAVAANDFSRRARVETGDHILDGISAGLNMLIEEIELRTKSEEDARARLVQAERLAAIGTLAAGVAHEINNPAAFLLGNFVALNDHVSALRGHIRQENQETLDEIAEIARVGQGGVERIASIVRGLRNFAVIEGHSVSELRLDEIAEQACILASHEVTCRARLVKNLARVRPILGERTKLTQVITNLLINAAQAIDGSSAGNEIELTVEERGDRILIRVRDTGRGIPLALQSRVFQPFFTTKSYGQGMGLALSVSADVARQHGGLLRFESEPGRGTTFELELPAITNLARAATPPPPPAVAPPTTTQKLRVLFIDDEEQLLRSYTRLLRGLDVRLASGGRAGLEELAKGTTFDVILCDISMPEVDGVDVWAWLEAHAPDLTKRVLFCTGGAFNTRGAAFVEKHRERVLEKPIDRARLQAAVERIVLECGRAEDRAPLDRLDRLDPDDRG